MWIFERYWTEHIDAFLQERGLVAKTWNKRAEWRDLDWVKFDADAEADLRWLADSLALKIARMAAAHALP